MATYKHKENDKELRVNYKIDRDSKTYSLTKEIFYTRGFEQVDEKYLIINDRLDDLKNQLYALINDSDSINECIDCIVSDGLCEYTDATEDEQRKYQETLLEWLELEI